MGDWIGIVASDRKGMSIPIGMNVGPLASRKSTRRPPITPEKSSDLD
jgi:hypothetical protein